MKHKFSIGKFIIASLLCLSFATAATLSYAPLVPQTGDSALVIANKQAVANCRLAAGNSGVNITTATTTTAKATAGVLVSLIVNTGGASSIVKIYDGAAAGGTLLLTASTASQIVLTYNIACATNITVVTSTGTPADVTVVYR